MSIVVGFESGRTSSGMLTWHAAKLDCGHSANVQTKPMIYECCGCHKHFELQENEQHKPCDCGKFMSTQIFMPDAGKESDRITRIGDVLECGQCATIDREVTWIELLDKAQVHHIRFRPQFGGTYTFYKLDHTSPSNFFSIGRCYATPETDAAIARKGLCAPISPTEQA